MIYPYLLIIIASIFDFISTKSLIEKTDFLQELNPFQRYPMMWTGSVWSILVVKLLVLFFAGVVGILVYKKRKDLHTSISRVLWSVFVIQSSIAVYGGFLVYMVK